MLLDGLVLGVAEPGVHVVVIEVLQVLGLHRHLGDRRGATRAALSVFCGTAFQ